MQKLAASFVQLLTTPHKYIFYQFYHMNDLNFINRPVLMTLLYLLGRTFSDHITATVPLFYTNPRRATFPSYFKTVLLHVESVT